MPIHNVFTENYCSVKENSALSLMDIGFMDFPVCLFAGKGPKDCQSGDNKNYPFYFLLSFHNGGFVISILMQIEEIHLDKFLKD